MRREHPALGSMLQLETEVDSQLLGRSYVRSDAPFDGYTADGRSSLIVTRCFDEACLSGPVNGIWEVSLAGTEVLAEQKLPQVPYAWGAQPVASLGLFVFTDGEDILSIPLGVAQAAK